MNNSVSITNANIKPQSGYTINNTYHRNLTTSNNNSKGKSNSKSKQKITANVKNIGGIIKDVTCRPT